VNLIPSVVGTELDFFDERIDGMGERQNVDGSKIPGEAIKRILTQSLYG
jgi:hypothetical protein